MSPDGTVQMAFQLAYYRLHHHVAPTYESCNMQHFHHGRTETIRSATMGEQRSVQRGLGGGVGGQPRLTCSHVGVTSFCAPSPVVVASRTMVEQFDAAADPTVRRQLLQAAVMAHSDVAERARRGQGTDRHLLGLLSVARRDHLAVPALFTDPAYAKARSHVPPHSSPPFFLAERGPQLTALRRASRFWLAWGDGMMQYSSNLLSTSTVGLPFAQTAGFGPVHGDGYGLGYMVQDRHTSVCVSSFRASSHGIGSTAMAESLNRALADIGGVL